MTGNPGEPGEVVSILFFNEYNYPFLLFIMCEFLYRVNLDHLDSQECLDKRVMKEQLDLKVVLDYKVQEVILASLVTLENLAKWVLLEKMD